MEALPLLLLNLFLRRQTESKTRQGETALPVANRRESVKVLKDSVYMQAAATEVSQLTPHRGDDRLVD